jgi:hypothetical protein
MHVLIEHEDGSQTSYFGISDFHYTDDGDVSLWFHRDVEVESDNRQRFESGDVISAVSESGYDLQGAIETIGDKAVKDDVDVIVGLSHHYPLIREAVQELLGDDEFDGDLELIAGMT